MRTLTYETYLDKVYGCFVGKAISGNMGAPHEGQKMPMELPFMPEMINPDMPNDDLDLQVLWLDVVEKKGADFTSRDLLERFVKYCPYSPGEYAVMRKNFNRGIYPPYSGKFCNDYYTEGMGCPIRSEVWACLAVGNPRLAADFAVRDGQQDHNGESIQAERFLAALEAEAFFESDVRKLIDGALEIIPADSKFRGLVEYTVALCDRYGEPAKVLENLLFRYGHPDCTNMYQNMGITIMSLILGDMDVIKTSLMALNCGFDTDCTCATAGAVIGIIKGAKVLIDAYDLKQPTYTLGVTSFRRSNLISDLAEDIAKLGVEFAKGVNPVVKLNGAPEVHYDFDGKRPFELKVEYLGMPSVSLGGSCDVVLYIKNNTARNALLSCSIETENGLICNMPTVRALVSAKGSANARFTFRLPIDADIVNDQNIITFTAKDEYGVVVLMDTFGISGATPWKVSGPYWRTEPICNTQIVLDNFDMAHPYEAAMANSAIEGNQTDKVRHFHLNYATDVDTDYAGDTLFEPAEPERLIVIPQDSFTMDDLFGFRGPCAAYLSRIIVSDEERSLFLNVGYSSPFALYLNGELIARRDNFDNWTAENVHIPDVILRKGENCLVLRMTRANADAKYNVTFTYGMTCCEHVVGLKSRNPLKW